MYKVGISGKIGSGKSTLAIRLADVFTGLGFKSRKGSFATGIKELATYRNLPPDKQREYVVEYISRLYDRHLHKDIPERICQQLDAFRHVPPEEKPRKLLQNIGTLGRELDPDFWVNHLMNENRKYIDYLFIDDVRFPNELKRIDFHIHIDTDTSDILRAIYKERVKSFAPDYTYSDHESEKQDLGFGDYTVGIPFDNVDILLIASTIVEYSNALEIK